MASQKKYGKHNLGDLAYCVANAAYAAGLGNLAKLLETKVAEYVPENHDAVLARKLAEEIGLTQGNAEILAGTICAVLTGLWGYPPATTLTPPNLLQMKTCRSLMGWIFKNRV